MTIVYRVGIDCPSLHTPVYATGCSTVLAPQKSASRTQLIRAYRDGMDFYQSVV